MVAVDIESLGSNQPQSNSAVDSPNYIINELDSVDIEVHKLEAPPSLPVLRTKRSFMHDRSDSLSSVEVTSTVPVSMKSTPASPQVSKIKPVTGKTVIAFDPGALKSVCELIDHADKELAQKQEDLNHTTSSTFLDTVMTLLLFKQPDLSGSSKRSRGSKTGKSLVVEKKSLQHSKNGAMHIDDVLRENNFPVESLATDVKDYSLDRLLDTDYYYISEERNDEFHNIFKYIPKEERLVDEFLCALSKEFLYQGNIYITEKHICFNLKLLGWLSKITIAFKEITYIEKTPASGFFPNAISIETAEGKTQFTRFPSLDLVYELLKEIWSREVVTEKMSLNMERIKRTLSPKLLVESQASYEPTFNNKSYMELLRPSDHLTKISYDNDNDSIIESAIRSVDDYSPNHKDDKQYSTESSFFEEGDGTMNDKLPYIDSVGKPVFNLKFGSKFAYNGPLSFHETSFPDSTAVKNEFLLSETELDAPPGMAFQLLFSESNHDFLYEFSRRQDTSAFSEFTPYESVDDKGDKYREYHYTKALHYPVGPKSTTCYTRDTIQHLDYNDYIDILTTTKVPDVPSGGSFATKTRYMFRWASETTCILKVSFWVEWTGSSWIKGMIDSSCKSGQIEVSKTMIPFIEEFVQKHTVTYMMKEADRIEKKATLLSPAEKLTVKLVTQEISPPKEMKEYPVEKLRSDIHNQMTPVLLSILIILLIINFWQQMALQRSLKNIEYSIYQLAALQSNR